MSRTERQGPFPGNEWWGKRPFAGTPKGSKRNARWYKRRLHKKERREAKDARRRAGLSQSPAQNLVAKYSPWA